VVLGAAVSVVKRLFVVADAYAAKKARVFAEKNVHTRRFLCGSVGGEEKKILKKLKPGKIIINLFSSVIYDCS